MADCAREVDYKFGTVVSLVCNNVFFPTTKPLVTDSAL